LLLTGKHFFLEVNLLENKEPAQMSMLGNNKHDLLEQLKEKNRVSGK